MLLNQSQLHTQHQNQPRTLVYAWMPASGDFDASLDDSSSMVIKENFHVLGLKSTPFFLGTRMLVGSYGVVTSKPFVVPAKGDDD